MADLPNGTTIGGKKIIHKGIANKHRHEASQIDGLNTLATGSPGSGGGIDADVLSGNTYSDLTNEFLLVENDTIPEIILSNHPTVNTHAVSKLYMENSIPLHMRSGEFYGITSIGDLSTNTYSYSILDSYNFRFSATDCLINGWKYHIPAVTIDIRNVESNFENKEFYAYADATDLLNVRFMLNVTRLPNDNSLIYIGTLTTDATGIIDFEPIRGMERVGVGRYMFSNTPKENAIPTTDGSGIIDSAWIFGARGEGLVTLKGPNNVDVQNTYTYTMTNYNSFSDYTVSVDSDEATVSFISDDTIELVTPLTSPIASTLTLSVSKDGYSNYFPVTLNAEPPINLTGPSVLESRGVYTYTIDNYNPNYTYDINTDIAGATVTRTDDVIELDAPLTAPYEQSGNITVSREGSSDSIALTLLADDPIVLTGPDEVVQQDTAYYVIDNFNPNYTYNISVTQGSVIRSGDNIIYTAPSVSADTNVDITASREGSSYTKSILVKQFQYQLDVEYRYVTFSDTHQWGYSYSQSLGTLSPMTFNGYEVRVLIYEDSDNLDGTRNQFTQFSLSGEYTGQFKITTEYGNSAVFDVTYYNNNGENVSTGYLDNDILNLTPYENSIININIEKL